MKPEEPSHSNSSSYRTIFAVLFTGFVLSGIVGTLNGPILPTFIARWSLDDARAGLFFTVFYLGSLGGTLLSSLVIARGGYKPALATGYVLTAIGIAALNAPSHGLALAATAIYGSGYGLLVPATNLWVAEYSGHRRAAALNLLNLAWGLGAIVCPILVLYAVRNQHFSGLLWSVAAGASVLAIAQFLSPYKSHEESKGVEKGEGSAQTPGIGVAVGLAFLFYVYVGVETATSGWAAAHAKRVMQAGDPRWALAPTLFFVGLLSGRALASVILLHVKELWAMYCGLVLASVGILAVLLSTTRGILLASAGLAGLGCSVVFPTLVGWLAKWFGVRARKMAGVMFSLAAIGGASLPWIVGFVSKTFGSLRVGLVVPLAGCLAMLTVIALLRPHRR